MNKPVNQQKNGWLVIDKPEGMSSAHVVACVRKITGIKKCGHAGTLDPLASGVLPIALGEATKTVSFAMDHSKTYLCTATFGEMRDTDDREGKVIATSAVYPDIEVIKAALPSFEGIIMQVPPIYSAIKINGERAYALARAGEIPDMQPREVIIHRVSIVEFSPENHTATFSVCCGKGVYIRSFVRDLAAKLGACAYVSYLRRIRVGKFLETCAISLDKLGEFMHNPALPEVLLSVDSVLDDIPAIIVNHDISLRLRNGQKVCIPNSVEKSQVIRAVTEAKKLVALGSYEAGYFTPTRVFNC